MSVEKDELAGVFATLKGVGQGPAIVLIHGSADTPQAWTGVARLLQTEYTVYTPALPTLPATPPPASAGSHLALHHDLPWLEALLAHTGARLIAAHSYGALLALRWALAHPDSLTGLVLAEPIAWGMIREESRDDPAFVALERCVRLFERGERAEAMEWLIDYWNGEGFWRRLPDKVRTGLLTGAERTAAEVQSGNADRTGAREVADLRARTRVLAGARSTVQSLKVQQRLAEAIPGAELILLPEGGHQFLRSHPEAVAAAIRAVAGAD